MALPNRTTTDQWARKGRVTRQSPEPTGLEGRSWSWQQTVIREEGDSVDALTHRSSVLGLLWKMPDTHSPTKLSACTVKVTYPWKGLISYAQKGVGGRTVPLEQPQGKTQSESLSLYH